MPVTLIACLALSSQLSAEDYQGPSTSTVQARKTPAHPAKTGAKAKASAAPIDISEDAFEAIPGSHSSESPSEARPFAASRFEQTPAAASPPPSGRFQLPPGARIILPPGSVPRSAAATTPTPATTPAPSGAYYTDANGNRIYDNGAVVSKGSTPSVFSRDSSSQSPAPAPISQHLKQVGTGGYNDKSNGDRYYGDGTVADSKGLIKALPGKSPDTIPPGINMRDLNNYLSLNSNATLDDALQALSSQTSRRDRAQ